MYTTVSMRKETARMLEDLMEMRTLENPFLSYSKINIIAELITKEFNKTKGRAK